ncbi:MAG: sugar phosphate isomerase/epimerase [Caldilineaceae bacterium]|nr:sugar phosphate isomerase/epimerase [Caldilineaceae bacterium]
MQIGIFTKTFARPTLAAVLDAVVGHGLYAVQFNTSCAGLGAMPEVITAAQITTIQQALAARRLKMAALSGTFNMIHPNVVERQAGLRRLRTLAAACRGLDTAVITLCTGTRNPTSMWHAHPDNASADAWRDLVVSMQEAVMIGEEFGVTLAFEPEVSNVIDSAQRARRLLDELRSPRLKVVMDGANIFHAGELPHMTAILTEAFELLGDAIGLAHAKDLTEDGHAGNAAAGTGHLDYALYIHLLRASGYTGALVLHGLSEAQTPGCIDFLRTHLTAGA